MAIWNEVDHPRDDEGKFTYKGGGTSKTSNEDKMQNRADILYPTMKDKYQEVNYNNIGLGNYNHENLSTEDILYPTMQNNNENNNLLIKGSISYDKHDEYFRNSMHTVFGHEGGYNNDPNDYGGPTNMGITQSTYNNYCKKHNLPIKDVKNITREDAVQVYYDDYWKASGADKVNNPVGALILFDTAVLHGVGRAKQFYKASNGDFNKILQLRRDHYDRRVQEDSSQKKYLKGWNNRVNNLSNILKTYEKEQKQKN